MEEHMHIQFYRSSSGTNYVYEFIKKLPKKTVKKITRQLELLEMYDVFHCCQAGLMKKLKGYDLYEITINFNNIGFRIFCKLKREECCLLHIFVKKEKKTRTRHIKTALQRATDWEKQLALKLN